MLYKEHKREPERTEVAQLTSLSNPEHQHEHYKTTQPNLTKVLNDNMKLRNEISKTKKLFAKTVSRNMVLNNQTSNMEATMKNMKNRIRNLKDISTNLVSRNVALNKQVTNMGTIISDKENKVKDLEDINANLKKEIEHQS